MTLSRNYFWALVCLFISLSMATFTHAGTWSSGIKDIFGTAYEAYDSQYSYSAASPTFPISKTWFTGTRGALSEIYWPTIDTAQSRETKFAVTDGDSFLFFENENALTTVEWIAAGIPAYKVINSDHDGNVFIEKTIYTDPDRNSIIQKVKVTFLRPGLHLYFLHDPSAKNTPLSDSAKVIDHSTLIAWQGADVQAIQFSTPLIQTSVGFVGGVGDSERDLREHRRLTQSHSSANDGNVLLAAEIGAKTKETVWEFDVVISFGTSEEEAIQTGKETLAVGTQALLEKYQTHWTHYQNSVRDLSAQSSDGGALFRASVAVLKSMEDKTYAGAFVASPTVPWGQHLQDQSGSDSSRHTQAGGYHLVWPRDLFQMATTFIALDDPATAIACLNYLKGVQFDASDGTWNFGFRSRSKDGSFAQNMWVDGEVYWGGLQIDETAMPVMLAYRLWNQGSIRLEDYWDMVSRAADFVQEFGPWSGQERWEENFGASPSNIAAQISALWVAAEMAQHMGDPARSQRYQATADAWSFKPGDRLEDWTFTTQGSHGNGRYYTRVEGARQFDQIWNPNDNADFEIKNGGGNHLEKDIIDGGFLELVRYGVRSAKDPTILDSIPEMDATIRVDIPRYGPGFYRYIGDRYNYDDSSGRQTRGMIWPFLTGERGHYEIARAREDALSPAKVREIADPFIQAMERFSTPTHMLPEQVWDGGPWAGFPTGAATPLGWTHGEYIKLLRSRGDAAVFDLIPALTLSRDRLGLFYGFPVR